MTVQQVVDVLAAFRRPGSPAFARHFQRLPPALLESRHVSLLRELLADVDLPPKVRAHAAGALGEIGDDAALPDLVAALQDGRLRRCAAIALGRLGRVEAADALAVWAGRGDSAARWALGQVRPATAPEAVLAAIESGQLQAIGPLLMALDPAPAGAVAGLVVERLRAELAAGPPVAGWLWIITAMQHLPTPAAAPLLIETLQRLSPAAPQLRNRLLRTLGVLAPLEAVPALVDAVERVELPGHQQLAAVCLEKVLARHGDAARRRLAPARARLYAALQHLRRLPRTTDAFDPEVPWDHRPGTPGWRAEVGRAVGALQRLLDDLDAPAGAHRTNPEPR